MSSRSFYFASNYLAPSFVASAAFALFVLSGSAGCGDDASTDSDAGPRYDEAACADAVVPHRFGFRWELVNHRVSKWDLQLTEAGREDCRPRMLETEVVGGTFSTDDSDTPTLKYAFQDRTADSSQRFGTARRSLNLTISPEGVAEGTKTLDRADLNLEHFPRIVAFIDGFRFDTDIEQPESYPEDYNPAHGYTLHGVGASVEIEETSAESIELSYRLRFEPGASPDREKLNRTLAHAQVGGRLDLLLVGTSSPVQTGSVETTASYPKPDPQSAFEPPPEEQRRVELEGEPGEPAGIYGISSFDVDLTPQIECSSDSDCPEGETCESGGDCTETLGDPGFYLREITVDLELLNYDRAAGEATFLLTGFASNSTDFVAFWPMQTEFTGRMRWIQVGGASGSVRYDRAFETGKTVFPLVDMAQ